MGSSAAIFSIGCPLHRHIGPGAHQHQGIAKAGCGPGPLRSSSARLLSRSPNPRLIIPRADAHIRVSQNAQGIVNGGKDIGRASGGKAVFKAEYIAPGGKRQFVGQHAA